MGCNKCLDEKEYCGTMPACFEKGLPKCPAVAVIPSMSLDTTEGLKQLSNTVVHVISNNTTYYVDDKHRITEICSEPVSRDNYDFANNPEKFAGQIVFDYANNIAFYYDNSGRAFEIAEDFQGAIAAEANARIAADNDLQTEIDNLKNSPDVVDIVDTYADLEAYDTQHLGNNDIIRVLTDETHDGESSYYRWDKQNETWTFIGSINYTYTGGNGIDITDNEVSVKLGRGLAFGDDGEVEVKAGTGITVNEDGVSVTPFENYIQGVDVKTYHYTNAETGADTTIYYSIIPSTYKPKLVMADENNANVAKVPSDFDYKYMPTLMINASPWDTSTHETYGPLIIDGNIKVLNNLSDGTDTTRTIFAIAEDGTLSSINGTASADYVQTVAKYSGRAWQTVINDGINQTAEMPTAKDPRTFLAQGTDGTYVIGVCGGRTFDNTGMQVQDIAYFLINNIDGFIPRVAFNLDGGGSSTLNYKGIRQNPLVTFENRACPNYLVFTSPTAKDNGVFEAQSASNAGLIQNTKWNNTGYLDADGLRAIKHASMTISHGMLRQVNGFLTLLEFEFSTTEVIASYSKLLKHLPKSNMSSIQYFTIVKKASDQDSNNMLRQVYIQNTTSEDETCLINRFAMPAGDYIVDIVYASTP